MTLLLLILIPLIAAAVAGVRPAAHARPIALAGTAAALCIAGWACYDFDWTRPGIFQGDLNVLREVVEPGSGGRTTMEDGPIQIVPALGISLRLGVDSVALLLIVLTALLGPICVLASYTAITERLKTYYCWLLVLQGAMTAVFAVRDLALFYVAFEFTLIPMWILIHLYGSTNRRKAATKFFLYTFTGSLIALAGLIYVVWFNAMGKPGAVGEWTFDMAALMHAGQQMSLQQQSWVLAALLAGFAVKVPLFPLHTWLPLAHTEAPTAGSVILAGVLLKLGTYGIYRFALPYAPQAAVEYAPYIAALSIVGIVYAGLICWVQTDVKKLVAYSSVAHLGFCILGMFAFNVSGLTGSVLYMINHGLSTGALFLLIGMIYERYHTRSMKELGGLAARMPIWATFMVFFVMASVGLPGLNGFISEFLCILGAFQAGSYGSPAPGAVGAGLGFWYAFAAGTGMIVAAIYLLYMTGKIVWGPLVEPHGHHDGHGDEAKLPPDLNAREIGILVPLAVACLALGLYPRPLLDALREPTRDMAATMARARVQLEQGRARAASEPASPVLAGSMVTAGQEARP